MQSTQTNPIIIDTLHNNLLNWLLDKPHHSSRTPLETSQDSLGWHLLLEGIFASTWAETQNAYYIQIGKKNSGHRWLVELIKKMWKIAWDIWTYRNGIAEEVNKLASTKSLNQQITTTIETIAKLSTVSQPHLYSSKLTRTIKAGTNSSKRSWLLAINSHQQYLQKNKRQRIEMQNMQQNMKNFLKK
jgi:hypothetical protein